MTMSVYSYNDRPEERKLYEPHQMTMSNFHLHNRRNGVVRTLANDYVHILIYRPRERNVYKPQQMTTSV